MTAKPLIPFPQGCITGAFVRRVKRFSVEIVHNGRSEWVHSNNSGSMMGLLRPGAPVLASPAANPDRKLRWTQEAVRMRDWSGDFWVGVNTATPNRLLEAAFHAGLLPWAAGYTHLRREARFGESRLDACLTAAPQGPAQGSGSGETTLPPLWVECKNVTMVEDDVACFPDAATERGQKHIREMMRLVEQGFRAAFFYLVQRADGTCFGPADFIDPAYADLFWQALDAGVEVYPHRAVVTEQGIFLGEMLPVRAR